MELEKSSSSVAKAGLATGIVGTTLGVLNAHGGLGGIFGGGCNTAAAATWNGAWNPAMCCPDNQPVTRYDSAKDAKIAELEVAVALRDANTFTDQKTLELYKDYNARFNVIERQLAAQEVKNQSTADSFQLVTERMGALKNELCCCINNERNARECADNTIVNYVNATFYPKQVASVTTGSTTTPQTLYNPLPAQNCCDDCCC